jgi:hypothetical protein
VLAIERLLVDDAAVWSVTFCERRRLKSVWKEAMEERRRRELRRESAGAAVSFGPLLREGILQYLFTAEDGVCWMVVVPVLKMKHSEMLLLAVDEVQVHLV